MTKDFEVFPWQVECACWKGQILFVYLPNASHCFLVPLMQHILFSVTNTLIKVSWHFLPVVMDCTTCIDFTPVEIFEHV
jgi:hypothetical protein